MYIQFKDAIEDSVSFILSPHCKTEHVGYFVDARVDRSTVPDGWYVYEFRTTSNGSLFDLEEDVTVNFVGTFLTKKPILMSKGYRRLNGCGGYTFMPLYF